MKTTASFRQAQTHLTEELIPSQATKPWDPRNFFWAAHFSANYKELEWISIQANER